MKIRERIFKITRALFFITHRKIGARRHGEHGGKGENRGITHGGTEHTEQKEVRSTRRYVAHGGTEYTEQKVAITSKFVFPHH